MGRGIPSYIDEAGLRRAPLSYRWDDEDPEDAYGDEVPRLEQRISRISDRGILTLSAAFAEWIAVRLSAQSEEPLLLHYIDAVRACSVDLAYTDVERSPHETLDWDDWEGPVRGPIAAAAMQLGEVVEQVDLDEPVAQDAVYLANLVEYVLPDVKPFRRWRNWAIERLIQLEPVDEDEPRGNAVPIEALDPDFDFDPKQSVPLLRRFLRGLDYKKNPYLRSPAEMRKAGFKGRPYDL